MPGDMAGGMEGGMEGGMAGQGMYGGTTPIDTRQAFLATFSDFGTYSKAVSQGGIAAAGTAYLGYGAAIGFVAGVALSLGNSVSDNIKTQRVGTASAYERTLTDGKTNLRKLTALINTDPTNADRYLELYNQQQMNIDKAYQQLKIDSASDLNLMLSEDGTRRLAKFESYYAPGGLREISDMNMALALSAPNQEKGMMDLMMIESSIGQ
jgi:hypothetical protein